MPNKTEIRCFKRWLQIKKGSTSETGSDIEFAESETIVNMSN